MRETTVPIAARNTIMDTFNSLSVGGGGLFASAFENLVYSYSPQAMYTFDEVDYTGNILDVSGNGYHLSKITTASASVIAPMRSMYKTQACRFPYGPGFDWGLSTGSYRNLSFDSIFEGTQNGCITMSMRYTGDQNVASPILFGIGPVEVGTAAAFYIGRHVTTEKPFWQGRTTGAGYQQEAASALNDNAVHIVSIVASTQQNKRSMIVDGVEETTFAFGGTFTTWGMELVLNQHQHSSYNTFQWDTDHCSFWCGGNDVVPTVAQVIEMHTAYLAEV